MSPRILSPRAIFAIRMYTRRYHGDGIRRSIGAVSWTEFRAYDNQSNPKKGDFAGKVGVRCYEDKGTLMFQFARYQNNQVFHLNYAKEEAKNYILSELVPIYRQMQFFTTEKQYTILISKKGKITIKGKTKKVKNHLFYHITAKRNIFCRKMNQFLF